MIEKNQFRDHSFDLILMRFRLFAEPEQGAIVDRTDLGGRRDSGNPFFDQAVSVDPTAFGSHGLDVVAHEVGHGIIEPKSPEYPALEPHHWERDFLLFDGAVTRPPVPEKPPATMELDQAMASGLTPGGRSFKVEGPVAWDTGSTEKRLLRNPEAVCQGHRKVVGALSDLGPLTMRQLVQTTGLSEDLLGVFLRKGSEYDRPEEAAASLIDRSRGLVTQARDGRFSVTNPDELAARQQEAVNEARQRLERAETNLGQIREVLSLARPFLVEQDAELAAMLKPGGGSAGEKNAALLLAGMQKLDLVAPEVKLEDWLASWNKDPKTARSYWVDAGLGMAMKVVGDLDRVTGYEALTTRMAGPWLGFEPGAVAAFSKNLGDAYGTLAHTDVASVLNGSYLHRLGTEENGTGPGARSILTVLMEAVRQESRDPAEAALASLQRSAEAQQTGLRDQAEYVQAAEESVQRRTHLEEGLATPQEWGRYLDEHYVVGPKILEKLESFQKEGRTDAVAIAHSLPFTGITPELAAPAREFIAATLQGDKEASKRAAHALLELKEKPGVIGRAEYGEERNPTISVSLHGTSIGGNQERYLDNPYWVSRSRDAELVQDLLGINHDAFTALAPISQLETTASHSNDRLFEDLMVARVAGEPTADLQAEALALHMEAEARRFTGVSKSESRDDLLWDGTGGVMMACGGFEWKQLDKARDISLNACRVKAWARVNGAQLPLSPQAAEEAVKAKYWAADAKPADSQGLDFMKLARFAMESGASALPADKINELLS
ncbi:MAG: hypothetical protein HY319_16130 [Armatimonadetes bacterium]|nr:hypothetical protein [Armatimonadota bacterium]